MKGGKRVDNCVKSEEVRVFEAKKSKKKPPVEVMPTINDGKYEKKGGAKKKPDIQVKDTTNIG